MPLRPPKEPGFNDGVALYATSHPRSRWSFWRNLWWKLFPPDIHADALETVDFDLGNGEGLTYIRPPLPRPANRIEEELRRRLNDGDGA